MSPHIVFHIMAPVVLALLPLTRNYWFFDCVENPQLVYIGKWLMGIWAGCWILLPIILGIIGFPWWPLLFVTILFVGIVGGIVGDIV